VVPLAAAFGGTGISVRGTDEVEAAVKRAVALGGLWLIEAKIDPSAYRHQL
jgi:thiamine pyrophosphate-dependent acetolactate synthase large subunit-like protein